MAAAQYVANFIVQQARQSPHRFKDADMEYNLLIDSFPVTRARGGPFDQIYYMHL